ncbi:M14 family zinc carboxypeptidase [Aureitalea marina]|uniref:Peptidase M14 domain-containing protein n=1 Tax=Aureitalea marina TaxID=930804 RepID=A0A2S7KPG8_9FLAO|nr:M14 family zinc carboxypeptidase [Aureitalea marina]PQB04463.1 hypothetical protein BST85_05775 [Aureitalea marina]
MNSKDQIRQRYHSVLEPTLSGRYLPLASLDPLLEKHKDWVDIQQLGTSVSGRSIHGMKIGRGKRVILGWSQMHGNESTTTRACFDLLAYLKRFRDEDVLVSHFLSEFTFCLIPVLNPDGAEAYTRENYNSVDLNRDAVDLSQPESQVLRSWFDELEPELCLNLHGQRSIYGMDDGNPSIISFLAPAADQNKSRTAARLQAMDKIGQMAGVLNRLHPGCIGLYDDGFNPNCVGDTFQAIGIPTILFEAGHFPGDYNRDGSRELIFLALMQLFGLLPSTFPSSVVNYDDLPRHSQNFRDLILRNVGSKSGGLVDMALQLEEELVDGRIRFVKQLDQMGELSGLFGHFEVDLKGESILINSHENVFVGDKVLTIHRQSDNKLMIFLQIP